MTNSAKLIDLFLDSLWVESGLSENTLADNTDIYSSGKTIYIRNPKQSTNMELTIYNIIGQAVQTESLATDKLNAIPTNLNSGIYIVAVRNGNEVLTQKVFIK